MSIIRLNDEQARSEAAKIVASGGVIAFRTDTFYGLGADPFNAAAVQRIRDLKVRDDNKPILLLISSRDQVSRFIGNESEQFATFAERFWPGPITLVGCALPDLPGELTAGGESIGLRLPDDERVQRLVQSCGGALTATSANPSGKDAARSATEVKKYFGDGIDLIIDDGEVSATQPSTVLDLTSSVRLIREGAISRAELGL